MISNAAIAGMAFTFVVSLGVPAGLLWYCRARYAISFKVFGIGVLIFVVFSQVLEKIMHLYLLRWNASTAHLLQTDHWLYAAYGGLAAGAFEECGRYFAFTVLLRKFRDWKDGVAYGLGHGGVEALLIGVLTSVNSLVIALLINFGVFDTLLSKAAAGQAQAANLRNLQIAKDRLIHTPAELFMVAGCERVMALLLQIALSLLVLYGVRQRNVLFLLLAIGVHTAVDFPAGLAQTGLISIWSVEGILLVAAILSVVFIVGSRRLFERAPPLPVQN